MWIEYYDISDLKILYDFFSSALILVDRVIWYPLLVGGGNYPVKLIDEFENWPGHHNYIKKIYYMY